MSPTETTAPPQADRVASGRRGGPTPDGGMLDGPPAQVLDIIKKGRGDILRQARLYGLHELPLSSATEPNNDEQHYIDKYRGEHSSLGVDSNSKVEKFEAEFTELEKIPTPEDVNNVLSATHAKIHDEHMSSEAQLLHDEEALRHLERQMKDFRKNNHLTNRPAAQPASMKKHFAVIAAIIVLESILNANFFAQASNSGLLGGWMEAMFISLMNVGVAVVVGIFVLRELWHVQLWRKVGAGIVMLGYVAFVVFFNLVTAHFRDLLEKRDALAHVQALPDALNHPFAMTFSSLMLFVVGIVWAGLGLREGVTSDDVYPGYGKLSQRLAEARLACAAARDGLWRRTKAILEDIGPQCAALKVRGESALKRMQEIEGEAEILDQRYVGKLREIQDTFERGLRGYREENIRIRMTKPPEYFKAFEKFPDQLDRDTLATFDGRRTKAASAVKLLQTAVTGMASKNNELQKQARTDHDKFMGEVETAADENIDLKRVPVPDDDPSPSGKS